MGDVVQVRRDRTAPLPKASRIPPAAAAAAGDAAGSDDPMAALLAQVAGGDRRAFARLYELSSGRLYALARGITGTGDLAEDVLQEAFLRVWRSAHRYDARRGPAIAWLTTVLRNRALTARAARARRAAVPDPELLESLADDAPDPLELVLRSEQARRINACLQQLDPAQREAVLLAFFEGLSHRELAARLGVPLGTAKSRIRRGLMRLARGLGADDGPDWRDLLAGEYVLGSLAGPARPGFERRRDRDARFCVAADRWEADLAALAELLPARPPPARLWRRIEGGLPRDRSRRPGLALLQAGLFAALGFLVAALLFLLLA